MSRLSQHRLSMIFKVERRLLSEREIKSKMNLCAPPTSSKHISKAKYRYERTFLCSLKKGSLTVEASLIMPFFLSVLLTFFSFFQQYALAAELKLQAAAEVKKLGVAAAVLQSEQSELTIYKTGSTSLVFPLPLLQESRVLQSAVCRAWIGFTELKEQEVYVYITPQGSVYHLSSDCTHLKLSVQTIPLWSVQERKNQSGQHYRLCKLCKEPQGMFVYITSEGVCYHSDRECSGLKRTIRYVPLSEVPERNCCMRCTGRKEME